MRNSPPDRRNYPPRKIWTWIGLASVVAGSGFCEGFRNPPPGTLGLGQAGAKLALVNDASAAWINPANLASLSEPEAWVALTMVHFSVEYDSPTGAKSSTVEPFKLLPSFFASTPMDEDGRWNLGLGVTSPFGISNEWEQGGAFAAPFGPLRYTAPYFAELKTINVQPTVAFKLCDQLDFGLGFDVMWSELTLKQYYPWALLPGGAGADPDGVVRLKGDGVGYGGNLGFTWRPAEKHSVALTYRSPIRVDYSGSTTLGNMPARAGLFGASERGPMETEVSFPAIVGAGYGVGLGDRFRLGVDFEWIQFSNFDELNLQLGNNAVLFPSTRIDQDWRDTFTAGIGGDWRVCDSWTLRASYQFYKSPVPDGAFSPTIPDANQQVFTVGATFRTGRHELGLAYGGIFYEDRDILAAQNPAYNGRYEVQVHLASASYRFRF